MEITNGSRPNLAYQHSDRREEKTSFMTGAIRQRAVRDRHQHIPGSASNVSSNRRLALNQSDLAVLLRWVRRVCSLTLSAENVLEDLGSRRDRQEEAKVGKDDQ